MVGITTATQGKARTHGEPAIVRSKHGDACGDVDVWVTDAGTTYVGGYWWTYGTGPVWMNLPADEVWLVTEREAIPPRVTDNIPPLVGSHDDDHAGYSYAWGRMDAGDQPVVLNPVYSAKNPCTVTTAWLFGREWARANANGGWRPPMQEAWEIFVATGGRSITNKHAVHEANVSAETFEVAR